MPSKKRYYGKDRNKLKYSKRGRPLCRYCETEVKPPKRTFCSATCVHEWKLRKSSSYLRSCVFKRDKGVCAVCKADTMTLRKAGKKMTLDEYKVYAKKLGMPYKRKTWYDVDHIVPVCEGGGCCGLENLRTLCCVCHKVITKILQKKLTLKRKMRNNRLDKPAIPLPPSSVFK